MKIEDYKQKIYSLVSQIPKGRVMTYGQIAKELKIKSPRIVGRVLHQNLDSKKVPCHRIVFADGSLSKSYAFGGMNKQKETLENEGVQFIKNKVNLKNMLYF